MKRLLTVVGLAALLAGCASNEGGMGGTSDQSYKTDSVNKTSSGQEKDQFHNNATNGTGSSSAPNSGTIDQ